MTLCALLRELLSAGNNIPARIAIIAILAGMLLPALNNARERARAINCIGNLKQISTSIISYSADNQGYTPPVLGSAAGAEGSYWKRTLTVLKYMPDRSPAFWCPSQKVDNAAIVHATDWRNQGYGMRPNAMQVEAWYTYTNKDSGGNVSFNIGKDKIHLGYWNKYYNPSQFILAGDSVHIETKMQTSVFFTSRGGTTDKYKIHSRHSKKANLIFADGSVRGETAAQIGAYEDIFNDETVWQEGASM